MLERTDLRGSLPPLGELRARLPRAELNVDDALHAVRPLVADVAKRGVAAALDYTERFDGVRPEAVRVPAGELDRALAALAAPVRAALEESIARARRVHADQRPADVTTDVVGGGTVTERWVPVERVGLYAPGGLAAYPSSVVMNAVPAQEAGVDSVVLCTPPQAEFGGLPHPTTLAAAALLGVDEVWAVGGAQAVALLAHGGTDTSGEVLAPVDMVTGPGNVYVTAAKRTLQGVIGIDSEAGTTEIAVLADDTADPGYVATDLISQAEHDPAAASVLVTPSEQLADAVDAELAERVPATRHHERIDAALRGPQSGTVLVNDLADGVRVVDAYAAEHLEIHTEAAREIAGRVRNAGAIFVGPYAPVSLGDYCAGSNHVLPTGGSARHSSGLSVASFLRGIHVVDYSAEALREVADHVVTLAEVEDLPAHGEAVRARFPHRGA
ncbi:histidinol dehydrogenase [Haloechinothrix sp. LS1_15]|uniref:histidinol dehydrogenase n=1 Tax=Haloechinothrix sp. LS1_15 TaxID=2652248 RepID=UPI00294781FE|nr:histidinol dehydrogenase [Haloechinothrix sp. LS1_15]MDV6012694.1 histidinol dehydrogenase [Haloechinothrix sp. LS1_15]